MRSNMFKSALIKSGLAVSALLLAGGAAVAQQQVNLTAAPANAVLPDGSTVPMWGYSCGAAVTGSTAACAALNPSASSSWSPVVITVPTGQALTINLTNSLSFASGAKVPTSLTIVGQLGGGLGSARTTTAAPIHAPQSVTWPTANIAGVQNVPPFQGPRVQSFATEVMAGTTTALTWSNLRPGTYLIESGTHPSIQGPMGLYGILVVTTVPANGTSYKPGIAYPAVTTAGGHVALPVVNYDGEVPILMSEIDPIQNNSVSTAVNTVGFSETMVWSGQPGGCGFPTSTTYQRCYPPAVNYTPLYYMMNGVAFNKTNASASLFPATVTPASGGSILVRVVNAGLRMHVPSIVNATTPCCLGSNAAAHATPGFQIIAEDGNRPNGVAKVQSDVFMAAGKTFDLLINAPAATAAPLPIFDRELSLSGNQVERDAGMLAYIGVGGANGTAALPKATATAVNDSYSSVILAQTLSVSDPSKGVMANDTNVYGVQLLVAPTAGTLTLNPNGTFSYTPTAATTFPGDSFTYCANGTVTAGVCSSGLTATVTLSAAAIEVAGSGATANQKCAVAPIFTATTATYLAVKTPGLLAGCTDAAGYRLTVDTSSIAATGISVYADVNGGFTAVAPGTGTYTFTYKTKNSQGTDSAPVTATLNFPAPSGLSVTVKDPSGLTITDYRWVIEEDRTFYIDPNCTTNPVPAGCPTAASGLVPTLGVNFHTSQMPFVAQGCTGSLSCEGGQTAYDPISKMHIKVVCDISNGVCRPDSTGNGATVVMPGSVALDSSKRYYLSVLPGDAANPFIAGQTTGPACVQNPTTKLVTGCGHGMGGAPIAANQTSVTVLTQPAPYPPGRLSVMVFEDDYPLNGEQDGGGGLDILAPNEPGLGGFQIHLWDAMGGNGDFTGQMTYDMFNQPLSNSLDGTMDPATGFNACPITQSASGITGMIVTCPKYESDGKTLSPLAGQVVIANLMPGRWGVIATPAADRIARGEEWLQTNTLDGQKAHDVFTRIGEPTYFQEYGPASYHVTIGFANPAIINARHNSVCGKNDVGLPGITNCVNSITGRVVGEHLSRTPDERIYPSGSHDAFAWSQCYVSFGDPDGEDFAFTKCNADGTFEIDNLPPGDWRVTTFDQWNDALVDGLSTPVSLPTPGQKNPTVATGTNCQGGIKANSLGGYVCNIGDIATTQWETNLYTRTFIDDNKDGVSQSTENGIPFANVAVRLRDGSIENLLVTDFTGTANFNETFPLFSWYSVETDYLRYKNTGTHVVYDVGGPTDGSPSCTSNTAGYPACGKSIIGNFLANTQETVSLPTALSVPGAVYCPGADCANLSIQKGPMPSSSTTAVSSGRIDPPWVNVEGWQGFPGQNNFLEFGKEPYVAGENGGIKGHVIYASTRPFDDPQQLVQTQWEPLVAHVTINLYKEGFAADGVTATLTLVDTTQTSSWDDWAQGFRKDATGNNLISDGLGDGGYVSNMNCPGQQPGTGTNPDIFFFSLYNQPQYLDLYAKQHATSGVLNTAPLTTPLAANSQYKCYDGMHNWNQIQPAPYDGQYQFPSVTAVDPSTGKPTKTNCTICSSDPVASPDLYSGLPMLPAGKYVVEVVVPPGMEIVKEEDKNILIGDSFIAPVTQQFGGLGNIFIIPDQASVASAVTTSGVGYNANNAQNPTQSFGATPNDSTVPGFTVEPVWPCVGTARIVPDYISLFPQSLQVAPFAGATRNLCDRKEVSLGDQQGAIAKFYIYTSTHIASKFYGGITDDYTSEFDPFSPQFGEKFAPPNLPVSVKDWAGNETNRVYADQWGQYNGMTYSTWEVNPPNPTGYSPTMMVFCMNDQGAPGSFPLSQGIDPAFNPAYSQFCYELPFMPGTTQYLDTPVVPTTAFAGSGYNNVDCAYPTLTPAVASVAGDVAGPWVALAGKTLTIKALGDQQVTNHAYMGPSATGAPYNQKTILRHYGFGGTQGTVTIGVDSKGNAIPAAVTSWSDTSITVTVPSGIPNCPVQQQAIYGGSTAQCGQLVITASTGQQSIDTVTVTVGGKMPTVLAANAQLTPLTPYGAGAIQQAIDAAQPGDLIIVPPGTYQEMLLMWKPLRLQGVGAASSIINANTQPAGKLDPWRREVNCLYGLALNGQPNTTINPFNPAGATTSYSCGFTAGWGSNAGLVAPDNEIPQVDRLPLEGILGWDTTVNGNLAQLLQEPTLMGAYEGAALTVLGKGVKWPTVSTDPFGSGSESSYPTGTQLLTAGDCLVGAKRVNGQLVGGTNPYPSNFQCNPSSIDGLTFTNSSQGGGAIFVHAWGHNLQIANNRVYGNAGTLTGGITIGQGESPDAYLQGAVADSDPGSCQSTRVANQQLPYCFNLNVNVNHNYVSLNSSIGDELYSSSPAGGGGVTFCTGADYYKFQYNWVCGNLSSGDGGGIVHLGYIWNGDIEHNTIIFNQSTNPTVPTNGGGLMVMGAPPDGSPVGAPVGTECGSTAADLDCTPGLSDGSGPGLVINANLIQGNTAESGTGGGIAFQNVNGTEVIGFPMVPSLWNTVSVTNNIIANNVAGWDGAGISLLDALNTNIINNTVISNTTTATAGILFNALGAPIASQTGTSCTNGTGIASCPQVAGIVSVGNSSQLSANINTLPGFFFGIKLSCPPGHFTAGGLFGTGMNANCMLASVPELYNNVVWQNSAYHVGVGAYSSGYQQNVVTLYNAIFPNTSTAPGVPAANQPSTDATKANGSGTIITGGTGACDVSGATAYWDIGVRGDTGPGNHASGVTLAPNYTVLTDAATDYASATEHNTASNPTVISQYCDGSRTPPEYAASGFSVPPGIADATVPNPIFSLTPVATVDEGNNWINLRWGPLSMLNPVTNTVLGNYGLAPGSPAAGYIPDAPTGAGSAYALAPPTDFYGNPRKATLHNISAGAVELVPPNNAVLTVSGGPLSFGSVVDTTTSASQTLTVQNTGLNPATTIAVAVTSQFSRPTGAAGGTCGVTLAGGAACTINIVFSPTGVGAVTGTATITASVTVNGSPVTLSGTGIAATISATLTPATWTVTQTRNCPGTGLGVLACAADPSQAFTLRNTGNVPLTVIAQGVLGGTAVNDANYAIVHVLSTCGPAGGGQLATTQTLAPGATCNIQVQFKPLTAQAAGLKQATISVTDLAGTQTSTLNGTAR